LVVNDRFATASGGEPKARHDQSDPLAMLAAKR
jgi:hypothetical protein